MLQRDFQRLRFFSQLHSVCPLGAGALSGTSLPIDPDQTASELGFERSFTNSYDVVGDRDTPLELLQIATQIMLHLSRLAEDFIYLVSTPVGWIDLPDALCTGSSMMPQKKNPDALELMRGKTASVIGHANALAILTKGLPTSYHRDLQQDKEHLFPAVDLVTDSLEIVALLLSKFTINVARAESGLQGGFLMATDLAEYLVGKGVPFRQAHEKVGALVGWCVEQGKILERLSWGELQELLPEADQDVLAVLDPHRVLTRRLHKGSTGLASIEEQIEQRQNWIERARE
jgi:argininosuccinate lyase